MMICRSISRPPTRWVWVQPFSCAPACATTTCGGRSRRCASVVAAPHSCVRGWPSRQRQQRPRPLRRRQLLSLLSLQPHLSLPRNQQVHLRQLNQPLLPLLLFSQARRSSRRHPHPARWAAPRLMPANPWRSRHAMVMITVVTRLLERITTRSGLMSLRRARRSSNAHLARAASIA